MLIRIMPVILVQAFCLEHSLQNILSRTFPSRTFRLEHFVLALISILSQHSYSLSSTLNHADLNKEKQSNKTKQKIELFSSKMCFHVYSWTVRCQCICGVLFSLITTFSSLCAYLFRVSLQYPYESTSVFN